jgi:hypothetical protein
MGTSAKPGKRGLSLDVQANITDRNEALPTLLAYAFSQGGALLDMQPLDKEGRTRLALPTGKEPQAVRVAKFCAVAAWTTIWRCGPILNNCHPWCCRSGPTSGGVGWAAFVWSRAAC